MAAGPEALGDNPEINEAVTYWQEVQAVTQEYARIRQELADLDARAKGLIRARWDGPKIPSQIIIPEGANAHLSRDNIPFNYAPEEFEASHLDELVLEKSVFLNNNGEWLIINDSPAGLEFIPLLPDSPE